MNRPESNTKYEKNILRANGLVRVYGGVRALDGLDLEIERDKIHCIIGPNGAGKSTFFKMLMGIEKPTSGKVIFNGKDVTRLPTYARARLGMAIKFQAMQVFQELSVYQNLFIPLRRHYKPRDISGQAKSLLNQLHLEGTEEVTVGDLSHGQQQWLAIGMSLAAEPTLLLLDEPTAGMSQDETRLTSSIIQKLNHDGVTVVVIEHDMEFIRNLNSTTSVLHYGQLFAQGTFSEIEQNDEVRRIYMGTL